MSRPVSDPHALRNLSSLPGVLIVGGVLLAFTPAGGMLTGCSPTSEVDADAESDSTRTEDSDADADADSTAADSDSDSTSDGADSDTDSDGGIEVDPDDIIEEEKDCNPKAIGILRDFQSISSSLSPIKDDQSVWEYCPVYRDFQSGDLGDTAVDTDWVYLDPAGYSEKGIPADELGPDRKPVLADPSRDYNTIYSADTYASWYRDDTECAKTFEYELPLYESNGKMVFDSSAFFPLDGEGFGTSGVDGSNQEHNFHFTFELHMTFVYNPGDVFSFEGDDDLWVYINDKLALDLGGAHPPQDGEIALDSLGLEPGKEYPIDFFHAERSERESNFHIETSLKFTNCDPIIIL